jgi:hypothetical protein
MSTLDLRPPSITIKFDQGKTLNPTFYYLSPTNSIINITGYTCRMQVKLNYTDVTNVLDLDNGLKGGLSIVTGTAILENGTQVPGAYGIQLGITATQTAALVAGTAYIFDIELVDLSSKVLPFLKGILLPSPEVTK